MTKHVGILTAGGDSPGLNAAIRGIGKAGIDRHDMHLIGFRQGFTGLMNNRFLQLENEQLSDILTKGGTILGTSRDKPHKMPIAGKEMDMRDKMLEVYHQHHLDVLVCIGGGGTQKNALRLMKRGMNVITLPKTIDNDVANTDVTFGFDTAMGIATEAIDRLHSTAHSHHRIMLVEIMGNKVGWLALGAGIAGGADVILLPEMPYHVDQVAAAIKRRSRHGKRFSIIAVAEGAMPADYGNAYHEADQRREEARQAGDKAAKDEASEQLAAIEKQHQGHTLRLAQQLEEVTGLESRVTILGYLQRGGTPSAADRILATRLGTACAELIDQGTSGVMVAAKGNRAVPVPIDEVAYRRKVVPLDHPWIASARALGTCLGD